LVFHWYLIEVECSVFYLDVSFGEVDLYIPRDWNIVNESRAFFRDIDTRINNASSDYV